MDFYLPTFPLPEAIYDQLFIKVSPKECRALAEKCTRLAEAHLKKLEELKPDLNAPDYRSVLLSDQMHHILKKYDDFFSMQYFSFWERDAATVECLSQCVFFLSSLLSHRYFTLNGFSGSHLAIIKCLLASSISAANMP